MSGAAQQPGDSVSARSELMGLRNQLAAERAAVRAAFESRREPNLQLQRHRRTVDRTLRSLWSVLSLPRSLSMLAVGGYGRGELFPHSDVDVLVLLPESVDAAVASKIEDLIGRLWDIGLEVGHSVRTVSDCLEEAAKDITVQTALLESRLVAGSRTLYREFDR